MSYSTIDIVSLIYSYARAEREKHKREKGVIWVTDLIRCPLKLVFEERYPELALRDVFKPGLIMGNLLHRGLESLLKDLIQAQGLIVETEVEVSRDVVLNDGTLVYVKGRLDAVISRDIGKVTIEVKTSRSGRNIPQKHHVDQVRAYNWLTDSIGTVLIYITPSRITQFFVEDRMDTSEVVSRITSKKAPRYSWECTYCAYSVLCPNKVET
ncbi:MAG: CRISPR-associated protein Cas4 [Sulfolobales archaeon]